MIDYTNKHDKIISFSIFLFFFIQTVNGSVKLLFVIPENYYSLVSNLSGIVYMTYFVIKALPIIYKRSQKILIKSYFLFIVLYIISALMVTFRMESLNWLLKQHLLWTLAFWIPVGVSAYSIVDYKVLYNTLLRYSFLISAIFIAVFIKSVLFMLNEHAGTYNMFFSYLLLIPTVLHLSYYLSSRSKFILLLFLFELVMITIVGSRGPLISIISYFVIKVIISNKPLLSKINTTIFGTLLLVFISFNVGSLNTYVNKELGLRSRTLSKFSNTELDMSQQLSGRDRSWNAALALIEEKPLTGYGLGGDYHSMIKFTGSLSKDGRSIHSAHNGLLELMLYFGIPVGAVLGLWLVFSIFKMRSKHSFYHRELIVFAFTVFVLPSVTVGGDIFTKPGIALYVFLILNHHSEYEKSLKL